MAQTMGRNVRRASKANSPDRLVIASNPTKAHGIIPRIASTCRTGPRAVPGANAGAIDASPPPCFASAAAKQSATHPENSSISPRLTRAAVRFARHSIPTAAMAATQNPASPSHTSNPARR